MAPLKAVLDGRDGHEAEIVSPPTRQYPLLIACAPPASARPATSWPST
jgi:hypothetical protein